MSSSYRFAEKTASYQAALEATEPLAPPARGFINPTTLKSALDLSREQTKQINSLIQLSVTIAEELNDIKTRLTSLEAELKSIKRTTGLPTDINQAISKLSEKLEQTHLSSSSGTTRVAQKGSFFVFKDPYFILEEERRKVKK